MSKLFTAIVCTFTVLTLCAGCGKPGGDSASLAGSSGAASRSSSSTASASADSSSADSSSENAVSEDGSSVSTEPEYPGPEEEEQPEPEEPASVYPVTPLLSAEASAALLNNAPAKDAVKLALKKIALYPFTPERAYNHHPQIIAFKGKLYASWSNGFTDEDGPGQRVMLATSSNFYDWTAPYPVVDTKMGKDSELVYTSGGFYTDGKTLNLYIHAYEWDASTIRGPRLRPLEENQKIVNGSRMMYVLTTADGDNWSAPRALPIHPSHLNTPPVKNSSGRLIMCAGVDYSYTDDPAAIADWFTASISAEGQSAARASGAKTLTEGSYFETKDRVLHMMIRTNGDYLYSSESYDNGESWSDPYKTNFTDAGSKFYFNKLPDGRNFYVGNPVARSNRIPLTLCLSKDGVNFDSHYIVNDTPTIKNQEGLYKGGVYGYPNAAVYEDYVYIIYSVWKERIEITRIPLSELV